MCLTPITVKTTKGQRVSAPCGLCAECIEKHRQGWLLRLTEHAKQYDELCFVTFTIENEHLCYSNYAPTLVKEDIQLYLKRLRKALKNRKITYFIIGEYGSQFERPHYHALFFGISKEDEDLISSNWHQGFTQVKEVIPERINYVTYYHILKTSAPEGVQKPFALISKGIGKNYVDKFIDWHREYPYERAFYRKYQYKKDLPRYYKEKLFTKREKGAIAIMARKRAERKMLDEAKNECIENYFRNKRDKIAYLSGAIKRKAGKTGKF